MATTGDVTITDPLPAGLTATAFAGTGWTCTASPSSCTRSDSIAALNVSLGRIDRIEDGREVCVAVFEQPDAVAADPFELELHSRTSPASGA